MIHDVMGVYQTQSFRSYTASYATGWRDYRESNYSMISLSGGVRSTKPGHGSCVRL